MHLGAQSTYALQAPGNSGHSSSQVLEIFKHLKDTWALEHLKDTWTLIVFDHADNDLNNETNANTSESKLCNSSESERNKAKSYLWSDQQTEFLTIFEMSIKWFTI